MKAKLRYSVDPSDANGHMRPGFPVSTLGLSDKQSAMTVAGGGWGQLSVLEGRESQHKVVEWGNYMSL